MRDVHKGRGSEHDRVEQQQTEAFFAIIIGNCAQELLEI